jgi:RHS repeat-associated protein
MNALQDVPLAAVPLNGFNVMRRELGIARGATVAACALSGQVVHGGAIPDEDSDLDGLTNAEEIQLGYAPWDPDTDADGLVDGEDEDPLAAAGTQVVFLHPDPLGSPAAVTSPSGQPVRQLRYGSYGELRSNVGATGTPDPAHKYTGKRLDPAVQLADYGARWYDPALAVFTQPDPLVGDPFDPQQLNRFAYVQGDPLNLTDPTGNFSLGGFFGGVKSAATAAWGGIKSAASWAWGGIKGGLGKIQQGFAWARQQADRAWSWARREGERAARWAWSQARRGGSALWNAAKAVIRHPATKAIGRFALDQAKGLGGQVIGTPFLLGRGLLRIGAGIAQTDRSMITSGLRDLVVAALPKYGSRTGLFWPGRAGESLEWLSVNDPVDGVASSWHDAQDVWGSSAPQFKWIDLAWRGEDGKWSVGEFLGVGPYGQAMRIFGTAMFGLAGAGQRAIGQ